MRRVDQLLAKAYNIVMFADFLTYVHLHWQDNVIASALWAVPGYFWSRRHFAKIHKHNAEQTARIKLLHKHIKELR